MTKYWSLRDEFYRSLHRWPSMAMFAALGCLLGWVLSLLWPPYFRATTQIYVGLNPYRTFEDANFLALTNPKYLNIDNYFYWQTSQLETFIYWGNIIQGTLAELRQIDPYWETITETQLQDMLTVEWRSAGKWELVAKHQDPQRAAQAAETWGKVAVKRVEEAVSSARTTFMIDQELQEIAREKLEASIRREELDDAKHTLLEWQETAKSLPQDRPLDPAERWLILSLATRLAQYNPLWMAILEEQPSSDSPPGIYVDWITQVTTVIDNELSILDQRIDSLEQQRGDLAQRYSLESKNSLGLSPNLEIEGYKNLPFKIVRPTGTFLLIGGILGLLMWVLTQLIIITNREKSQ